MKDMSKTNWGVRIAALGYTLQGSVVDNIGRAWRYRATPDNCGAVAYFDSLADMAWWTRQVEETRMMQERPEKHRECVEIGIYPMRDGAKCSISPVLPFFAQNGKAYHSDPLAK